MRGELDDALARLRRWNEVRERLSERDGEPASAAPDPFESPDPLPSAGQFAANDLFTQPDSLAPSAPFPSTEPDRSPMPEGFVPRDSYPSRDRYVGSGRGPYALPEPDGLPMPAPSRPAAPPPPSGIAGSPALEEVLDALNQVLLRRDGLAITVTIDDDGTTWTAHLERGADGNLSVTRLEPRSFTTRSNGGMSGAARSGGLAPEPSDGGLTPGPSAGGLAPGPSAGGLTLEPSAGGHSPEPRPLVPEPRSAGSPLPEPRSGGLLPPAKPSPWSPPDQESPERAASRLAEMIRQDPSLLDPPDKRGR